MSRRDLSREELFALVWEKPTQEIAKELGISDVAVGKMCARLQVPKPPRGYWARVQSGKQPRRPPLKAFREEVEERRLKRERARAAHVFTKLQAQFYQAALADLQERGINVQGAALKASRLPDLDPDIAAQILLLIQNRAHDWIKTEKVDARSEQPAQGVVEKLLPLARPQLLIFESEKRRYSADGPDALVRLTASLQERIGTLVRMVRDQRLDHVAMPLTATDHAWSVQHVYTPEARVSLQSRLCVSASEVWVEFIRRGWFEEDPPERILTGRISLLAIMPIDHLPTRDIPFPSTVSRAAVVRYEERLQALIKAEQVYEILSEAVYGMRESVPNETLALMDRIWFGEKRPFLAAREALKHVEDELEQWELRLEGERSRLAESILGIEVGDIVTTELRGRVVRLSVTDVDVSVWKDSVTFRVSGTRFRKDGTLGKRQDMLYLDYDYEKSK